MEFISILNIEKKKILSHYKFAIERSKDRITTEFILRRPLHKTVVVFTDSLSSFINPLRQRTFEKYGSLDFLPTDPRVILERKVTKYCRQSCQKGRNRIESGVRRYLTPVSELSPRLATLASFFTVADRRIRTAILIKFLQVRKC